MMHIDNLVPQFKSTLILVSKRQPIFEHCSSTCLYIYLLYRYYILRISHQIKEPLTECCGVETQDHMDKIIMLSFH